jgi:hypothetical protein
MKKLSALLFITLLAAFLTACGNENTEKDSNAEKAENSQSEENKSTDPPAKDDVSDVELTVDAEKTYLWKASSGETQLSYYTKVVNESDKPVDASNAAIAFTNKDNGQKIALDDSEITITPYIIAPGNSAFISVQQSGVDLDTDTPISAELQANLTPAEKSADYADVDYINVGMGDTGLVLEGEISNPSLESVTGKFEVVSALYNGQEFLGTMNTSVDATLPPKVPIGFKITEPPFPDVALEKIDSYEALVYIIR